jgi:histidine ammonia-lyase
LKEITLNGSSLTIEEVVRISRGGAKVRIAQETFDKVQSGRDSVERLLKSRNTVYGVNTGFGRLADRRIDDDKLERLQVNLIRSHSVGTGSRLDKDETRAIMAVRLNTLLKGYSGIRREIAEQLISFLNMQLTPEIPRYGSLGASGDLAPSAHLALTLIGEGNLVGDEGSLIPAKKALKENKVRPVKLREKEGLALINGTQVMTGLGCLLLFDSVNLFDVLDIAAALSLEALQGNPSAFDIRVHSLRPFAGQVGVAETVRTLVSGSKLISKSGRVQDPYSLRCVPQVHGAYRDSLNFAGSIIGVEINSVTDNPIIFPEDDSVVSAGNFHGQPVALALDLLGIAVAGACVISERRVDKLLSGVNDKLPLFLTKESGLNSGMMVLQYTAAALISQNKVLASPATLDSANVSAGQEDHSSMGVTAALKAREIVDNAFGVAAIELLCSCQAIEFLNPAELGDGTSKAFGLVRKISPKLTDDRSLAADIERLSKYLKSGKFRDDVLKHSEAN